MTSEANVPKGFVIAFFAMAGKDSPRRYMRYAAVAPARRVIQKERRFMEISCGMIRAGDWMHLKDMTALLRLYLRASGEEKTR